MVVELENSAWVRKFELWKNMEFLTFSSCIAVVCTFSTDQDLETFLRQTDPGVIKFSATDQ